MPGMPPLPPDYIAVYQYTHDGYDAGYTITNSAGFELQRILTRSNNRRSYIMKAKSIVNIHNTP